MARLRGQTGSITIAGHNADFASVDADWSQPDEEDTNYTDVGVYSSNKGSGIHTMNGSAAAFFKFNVASSDPGMDEMSGDGAAGVITWATGCTHTGDLLVTRVRLSGAKTRPVVAGTFDFKNAGALTKAWDETP